MGIEEIDEERPADSRAVHEPIELEGGDRRSKLGEREQTILDMWPRFEDGGYVCFGDAFVDDQGGERRVAHIALSEGSACIADSKLLGADRASGEAFKRPVAKVLDAEGMEIKVGDTVWSTLAGPSWCVRPYKVKGFDKDGCVLLEFHNEHSLGWSGKQLTHTRPDSWELLEEDAEKIRCDIARNLGDFSPSDFADESDSVQSRVIDLIRRAKALAGIEAGR